MRVILEPRSSLGQGILFLVLQPKKYTEDSKIIWEGGIKSGGKQTTTGKWDQSGEKKIEFLYAQIQKTEAFFGMERALDLWMIVLFSIFPS